LTAADRRRDVIVAGHRGDPGTARGGLTDADPGVRVAALGALSRLGILDREVLGVAFADPDPGVRARAAELAATRDDVDLAPLLHDPDDDVVEVAAWAHGERESVDDVALARLIELATAATEPLVRESAVAALGAIGDERGLPAILAATEDKPAVRRRAVLALAPFAGDDVDAALQRALADRDWQVRQNAQDLLEAAEDADD
jgi:HEAT repeat protein